MPQATINIKDDPDTPGAVLVTADYGDAMDDTSPAHGMVTELLRAIFGTAKTISTVEDTTGDAPVVKEEKRIITPN